DFGDSRVLGELALRAVQRGEMRRNQIARRVIPGSRADAVARIYSRHGRGRLGREIGAPGVVARALHLRQRLAVRIRASETAKVAAVTKPLAGDEEARLRFVAAHRDRRWRVPTCWRIGRVALLRFGLLIGRG